MRFFQSAACAGAALATVLGMASQPGKAQVLSAPLAAPPETLTLEEAIARATANEPAFAAAAAELKAAALDRKIARTGLLPTATYHNQAIYTQPNGVPASRIGQTTNAPAPVFIANNAVREYASEGVFNETLGLGQVGAIRLSDANAARAEAELEVARRGLVTAVVSLFYGAGAGEGRVRIAQEALNEANHFVEITGEREAAREAAHADVLKAQLAQGQRQRELLDAQVIADKARIELAVLLCTLTPPRHFALPRTTRPPCLRIVRPSKLWPGQNNPELRSALASVQISQADTYAARTALLPELAL